MAIVKDFVIEQGRTFQRTLRWETTPIVYKPITAIENTAPVRVSCVAHGMVDGWRAAVVSVKGMVQINANTPPRENDYHPVTVVDPDKVEINEINAADYKPYVSGGYLQFNTPVDMAGYTARMAVKDKVGGTVLLSLTTENGGIVIDNTNKRIVLVIGATASSTFTWVRGVYDLEMVSDSGIVTALLTGVITVSREVTT